VEKLAHSFSLWSEQLETHFKTEKKLTYRWARTHLKLFFHYLPPPLPYAGTSLWR